MNSVTGAIGSYYAVKNMNASITAQASLQKISQNQAEQQMKDLLKSLPALTSNSIGLNLDVRV